MDVGIIGCNAFGKGELNKLGEYLTYASGTLSASRCNHSAFDNLKDST